MCLTGILCLIRIGVIVTGKQIDRLIDILDRAVKVAERWADREYPQINEINEEEVGISRVGDRAIPQSVEAYKAFEAEISPLEKRIRNLA
jgi:hypothetical protein